MLNVAVRLPPLKDLVPGIYILTDDVIHRLPKNPPSSTTEDLKESSFKMDLSPLYRFKYFLSLFGRALQVKTARCCIETVASMMGLPFGLPTVVNQVNRHPALVTATAEGLVHWRKHATLTLLCCFHWLPRRSITKLSRNELVVLWHHFVGSQNRADEIIVRLPWAHLRLPPIRD